MPFALRTLLFCLAVALAAILAVPTDAEAQCRDPGQTCGLFGGSCCSGASCVIGFCVSNCAGENGPCVSSSTCCGSRVCENFLCQTPVDVGEACGPLAPCKSGLFCDPFAGFHCVGNAGLGGACGPFVHCNSGLVCDPLAGFRCVSQTAQLGQTCGPLVQCAGGLVCDPLAGFRCVDQTATLGQACGPLVQCESGLVCDPFAGFVCVDQNVGAGQACGPLVQCNSGLVCDPLAGFHCVPATTSGLGKACGPLFPCAAGLACDPLAGFVCVDQTVGEGDACGPLVQCGEDLFCDPFAGFRCVSAAGVDQPCGPGVPCEGSLQCTLALRCSNTPAQPGETCDVTAPCDEGLFCQPGIPQRCQALKKPGEGCSVVNPCVAGASCEPCFVDGCSAPLQCFPNANEGAISEQACRALHSPALQRAAADIATTMTFAVGNGIAAVVGEEQSFGVAYGQDGRFGCYTSLCGGLNLDFAIEHFAAVGFSTTFDAVGGKSFASFQEAEIPGDLLNFSTSQIFSREDVLPIDLTGTESAFSIGISPEFALPFSAGAFLCVTVLDTVLTPTTPLPAVAPAVLRNPGFALGLGGWSCVGAGTCARSGDDVTGTDGSGSGEVASPPPGSDPGIAFLASACTGVAPSQDYEISAWVKTLGARPGALIASWNAGLECDGPLAASDELGVSPPDGTWRPLSAHRTAPAGAQSVQLLLSAERDANSGAGSISRIDIARIPEPAAGAGFAAALLALAGIVRRRARWAGRALLTPLLFAAASLSAPPAGALVLPFTGTIKVELNNFPVATFGGAGFATINGSGAGIHVSSLALGAGAVATSGLLLPITDPAAAPVEGLQITAGNGVGAFAETGMGVLQGTMPILGIAKVCLFGACNGGAVANLSVPLSVIGVGGRAVATGPVNVTVAGAPWTTGTVVNFFPFTPSITTRMGFARGPDSQPSSTAQPSGSIQLVTPIVVWTNIGVVQPSVFGFATAMLHFVPEPATLMLLMGGCVLLELRARSAKRA